MQFMKQVLPRFQRPTIPPLDPHTEEEGEEEGEEEEEEWEGKEVPVRERGRGRPKEYIKLDTSVLDDCICIYIHACTMYTLERLKTVSYWADRCW